MKHFEDFKNVKDLLSEEDIKRHEQGLVTTLEMDELTTRDEILNKDKVVMQCIECGKWTIMKHELLNTTIVDCHNCGSQAYDRSSLKSSRSFNPEKDNKRRIKTAIKRTHESKKPYKGS